MKNYSLLKRFFIGALLPLLTAVSMTACSDDEEGYDSGVTGLTVSQALLTDGVTLTRAGGVSTFSVQSVATVEAVSSETWCTVEASTPTAALKVVTITLTATENTTNNDRTATITLTSAGQTASVQVTQLPTDGLLAETTSYNAPAEGGPLAITVSANSDLEVTCNDTWITLPTSRANMSDRTYNFELEQNYAATSRTGSVTFTLGTLSETVSIVQAAAEYESAGMESSAIELAQKMYAGINIGNTLEVPGGETGWGNPVVSKTYVDGLKAAGFNAVRIPCAWNSHIINTETNEIDPAWLDRVSEVVGYCRANEMYAIVNIHWDDGWLEESFANGYSDEINEKQRTLWTQIATKLNVYDEYVLFAACNEPVVENADQMATLETYEQTFVDAVRATGGNNANRVLIVQGPGTDVERTYNLFNSLPTDDATDRLMVEVHYYTPSTFCILSEDADWGDMDYFWGSHTVPGSDRNADWGDANEMRRLFGLMKTKFVDNNIPVILGEYAAVIRSGLGENQEAHDLSRQEFDETVTREAKNHGMVPFYWETGSVINRYTGSVINQYDYDGLMQGAADGTYPY